MKPVAHIIRTRELDRLHRAIRDIKFNLGEGRIQSAEERTDDLLVLLNSITGGSR